MKNDITSNSKKSIVDNNTGILCYAEILDLLNRGNLLLGGPSGIGKTYLANKLLKDKDGLTVIDSTYDIPNSVKSPTIIIAQTSISPLFEYNLKNIREYYFDTLLADFCEYYNTDIEFLLNNFKYSGTMNSTHEVSVTYTYLLSKLYK